MRCCLRGQRPQLWFFWPSPLRGDFSNFSERIDITHCGGEIHKILANVCWTLFLNCCIICRRMFCEVVSHQLTHPRSQRTQPFLDAPFIPRHGYITCFFQPFLALNCPFSNLCIRHQFQIERTFTKNNDADRIKHCTGWLLNKNGTRTPFVFICSLPAVWTLSELGLYHQLFSNYHESNV